MNAGRILAMVLGISALLAGSVAAAPLASADCRVINQYKVTDGGYWDQFEVLLVPPSSGPVVQTITTTRTLSSASTVGAEVGGSVKTIIAEVNSKLHASYAETVTIEAGRSTTMTAPPNDKNQEIRFGTFKDVIMVTPEYWGCPPGASTPNNSSTITAAKPAAGIVVVG